MTGIAAQSSPVGLQLTLIRRTPLPQLAQIDRDGRDRGVQRGTFYSTSLIVNLTLSFDVLD